MVLILTSKREEAKEGNVVDKLLGVVNFGEETVMGVGPYGVVPGSNLGGEGIGNIFGLDDSAGSADIKSKEEQTEHDTSREDILVGHQGQFEVAHTEVERVVLSGEGLDVLVGEQVDSGKDIGTVDEDTTDDDKEDQHISELAPARVVDEVVNVDKVETVVLNLFTFPVSTRHDC